EVEVAAHASEAKSKGRIAGAWIQIGHHYRTRLGAIRLPQLAPRRNIGRHEENEASDARNRTRIGICSSRVDVFHQDRPRRRPIALPELLAIYQIIREEVD